MDDIQGAVFNLNRMITIQTEKMAQASIVGAAAHLFASGKADSETAAVGMALKMYEIIRKIGLPDVKR